MKKYFTLFLSPLLSVMCTASFLWVNNGAFVLLIMLFRDLCVPLIHFGIIGSFIKRSDVKKSVSALAALSLLPIVIFNGLMFEALFTLNIVWFFVCAVIMLGITATSRADRNSILFKVMLWISALVALGVNALITYFLSSIPAVQNAGDGIEIILLLASALLLSAYSYFLGVSLTEDKRAVKLAIWFMGIAASVYVSICLLGTPVDWTITPSVLKLCTVISVIIFAFSLVGPACQKISQRRCRNA